MSTTIGAFTTSRPPTAKARRNLSLAVVTGLLAASVLTFALRPFSPVIQGAANSSPAMPAVSSLGVQPLAFEPNGGQTDPSARFIAHAQGSTLFFMRTGVTLSLANPQPAVSGRSEETAPAASVVRLEFVGASAATLVADGPELPGKVNYIVGNDPAKWHTNLQTYAGISYSGLYNGVTLKYEGVQGHLKGTYTVAAGADPNQIRWRYAGAALPKVDAAGNLIVVGQGGETLLTEQAPVAWQEVGAQRSPVTARYDVARDGSVQFALGSYNRAAPLVIDPTLQFSTFLGGSAADQAEAVAVDASGSVYVAGFTNSTNFPIVNGYQPSNAGPADAFVTKFNANGTVAYSTYLGGLGSDYAHGIAVDAAGNAYISGQTSSTNFPTQNGYQPTAPGGLNAFLTKLNAAGSALLYSTYFGGTSNDYGWGVALGGGSNAYMTGNTSSTAFPVLNAYQSTYGGGFNDAFLVKLDTSASGNASLLYSTYLGGSAEDYGGGYSLSTQGHGVAADAAGNVYVAGQTYSANFPTRSAYDPSFNGGGTDGWVAKLNTTLSGDPSLIYSTFLGGTLGDEAFDVDIDSSGSAYATGRTVSSNFPTQNPYAACFATGGSFVTKLNATGDGLVYSTCFGSGGTGVTRDIAVDGSGRAHVIGSTNSTTFPQVNPIQPYGGNTDAFVVRLNPAGNTLAYSTYLGGSATESGVAVGTDGADKTYAVGSTFSGNFPTLNAYQPACSSCSSAISDAFVTVIDDQAPIATVTPTRTPTRTSTNTPPPGITNTPTSTPTRTPTFTPVPGNNPPIITVPLNRPYRVGVEISNYLALRFDATDPDAGDIVSLSVSGLPSGASFPIPAPGNPIYSTLTWRPTASDIGTYFVTVTATDSFGAQDVAIVQIDVVPGCVPYFSDVFTTDYFYPAVQYLFCHFVISGYIEPDQTSTYRPYNHTTRGQFSKMISLAYNLPPYNPPTPDFSDVPVDNPFYSYIESAFYAGIIGGYADGTFRPFNNITRGQLSKLVVRAAGWPVDLTGAPHFSDVPPDSTFYDVIETAFNHGIITGYQCGGPDEPCDPQNRPYFRAGNSATRGQIAKILWLALGSPSPLLR